jgi:single-stranded DNA-specific DHH superfamily exonuclease
METSEIIDTILADRGVEDITALLYPDEDCLIPFEKMKNIDMAAKIITENIENDGSFFVHFDTDTDGISA